MVGHYKTYFSYADVCKLSGIKNFILPDSKGKNEVDCTKKTVNLNTFCKKQNLKGKSLLKGHNDKLHNKAVCQYGSSLSLTITCDQRDAQFCKETPQGSCKRLKAVFAQELILSHQSMSNKTLKCYYSSKI